MKKLILLLVLLLSIILYSCNIYDDVWEQPFLEKEWLINEEQIQQGCYNGKDCIPSLENPKKSLINGEHLEYLKDDDLVVGIWNGEDYIVYPHPILEWHEIANENGYCISFCPLTGSAIHFNTEIEFGVSGLLFNSNLIMYDRESDSYWSQMLLKSVSGEKKGSELNLLPLIETTWENWKRLFPDSFVLNSNTDLNNDLSNFDYGNEKLSEQKVNAGYIPIPISQRDTRLPLRERVLTIIDNNDIVAIPISDYIEPTVLSVVINNNDYRVILSAEDDIAIAFDDDNNIKISQWNIENGKILLVDNNKTWNLLGIPINGNHNNLQIANSYISYWFAVAAIFPEVKILKK